MPTATSPLPTLKAVADGSRLRLLRVLDREELSVGELARVTALPQSSVSRHLAVLRRAGLVEDRADGARSYSRLARDAGSDVAPLVQALLPLVRSGDLEHPQDLSRLDALVAERDNDREALFDSLAEDWDALRAQLLGGALGPTEIAALLVPEGLRIVDAGAGTGVLLPWLSALVGESGEVVAVERAARMAKKARARARDLPNVRVERGRIEELPVPDRWADAVVFCLALGHARNVDDVLRSARCALRDGGRIVVADIESHGDATLVRRLGGGFAGFEPGELVAALERAGFESVRRVELPSPNPSASGAAAAFVPSIPSLVPLRVVGVRPQRRRRSR